MQTKEGAKKAKQTTIARHGKDFYKRAGSKGGNPMLKNPLMKAIYDEIKTSEGQG